MQSSSSGKKQKIVTVTRTNSDLSGNPNPNPNPNFNSSTGNNSSYNSKLGKDPKRTGRKKVISIKRTESNSEILDREQQNNIQQRLWALSNLSNAKPLSTPPQDDDTHNLFNGDPDSNRAASVLGNSKSNDDRISNTSKRLIPSFAASMSSQRPPAAAVVNDDKPHKNKKSSASSSAKKSSPNTPNQDHNFMIDKKGKTRILVKDKIAGSTKPVKIKNFHVRNPYDTIAVGDLISRITPLRSVATIPSSSSSTIVPTAMDNNTNNSTTKASDSKEESQQKQLMQQQLINSMSNEALLTLRVAGIEISGGNGGGGGTVVGAGDMSVMDTASIISSPSQIHRMKPTKPKPSSANTNITSGTTNTMMLSRGHNMKGQLKKTMNPKMKNKLRYVCIVRSTNRTLMKRKKGLVLIKGETQDGTGGGGGVSGNMYADGNIDDDAIDHSDSNGSSRDDDGDDDGNNSQGDAESTDGYDTLYNPDSVGEDGLHQNDSNDNQNQQQQQQQRRNLKGSLTTTPSKFKKGEEALRTKSNANTTSNQSISNEKMDSSVLPPEEEELSSFPTLVCLALQSDGTYPDVRKILDLEKLVAIESIPNKESIQLVFQTGDVIEIDCDISDEDNNNNSLIMKTSTGGRNKKATALRKERFLWSLLQIHAILCTSVAERNMSRMAVGGGTAVSGNYPLSRVIHPNASLPQLTMRNVDRAELQYISTVNGFLSDSPVLCALLERQRNLGIRDRDREGEAGRMEEEKDSGLDEMDDIAYDMIMGNFTRLTLFLTEEEKQNAEEILNSTSWQVGDMKGGGSGGSGDKVNNFDEIGTAEALSELLQKRMHDLEAETCRRLIAWEDEKYYSATGTVPKRRDTMDALSLSNLFDTLDSLDAQLDSMEEWLEDKATAIKPLTDDCRAVEEENRQLEQQKKSYEMLGLEMQRLLSGLDVSDDIVDILRNPRSKMVYRRDGSIDLEKSEEKVEEIYMAGRGLKETFDQLEEEGGVYLKAVNERVQGLSSLTLTFCDSLARIVREIMERTVYEVVDDLDFTREIKQGAHSAISKTIRDTQRKFQSSLLAYIKLIEVLALLKPSILASVRSSYSEIVSEGILSKKRMKAYFASLPGNTSNNTLPSATMDLRDYTPSVLRGESDQSTLRIVQAKGVEVALSELLPVIAREAYFTAALFGLSGKHLSSREKKKNFENAKKSVDHSSQYFKYYIARICGIASEVDAEGKKVIGDPMLSFVSSIVLNEQMDGYIDRQKKGGDHSLSLAYVRATIIGLRKKVDKQWVTWVEEQIKWIISKAGVPLNGKRAGIIASFSRFPTYLDHLVLCCKNGRHKNYSPDLSKIKVVSYYLQKMAGALLKSLQECSERETTDRQYAANVILMENSYFFTQTIKQRDTDIANLFQKQVTASSALCKKSTDAYLGWMIKREFKPLHSLFSNISRIRRDVGDADVPIHMSRSTFERTIAKECNKDILKEKISVIFYRMEKHLSEGGGLLPVAWKALVKVLYEWFTRWETLSTQCYKLTLEPSAVDVVRIAKQAAGVGARRSNEDGARKSSITASRPSGITGRRSSTVQDEF